MPVQATLYDCNPSPEHSGVLSSHTHPPQELPDSCGSLVGVKHAELVPAWSNRDPRK